MRSAPGGFQFYAYVIVDWSANNSPKTGKDSIWYCVLERADGKTRIAALHNPPTRHLAYRQVRYVLKGLAGRGLRTLVGFDFPYGYPHGFADALKSSRSKARGAKPWIGVWDLLSAQVADDERNRSNRFEVAAALNSAISGTAFPFWGCPSNQQGQFLTSKRVVPHVPRGIPEYRVTDRRIRGPQPAWKLCYPGSVGSQALVGIPYVHRLRYDAELAGISRVWPFETGFRLPPRMDCGIIHAEIYPSIRTFDHGMDSCKDQAQVRGLARYFAEEDETGRIEELFGVPTGLSAEQVANALGEEGWTLGVR